MENWSPNDKVYDAASLGGWSVDPGLGFIDWGAIGANVSAEVSRSAGSLAEQGLNKVQGAIGLTPPPPPAPPSYTTVPRQNVVMMPPPPGLPPQVVAQTISEPLFTAKTKKMLMIGGISFAALLIIGVSLKMILGKK
jgi:hypothetical protein